MTDSDQKRETSITPPYYAVIFLSSRTTVDDAGYTEMAQRMDKLAQEQPGFLKIDSVRGENGKGITISYWKTLEAISAWRSHTEHLIAQEMGRSTWYQSFELQICRVERAAAFHRSE